MNSYESTSATGFDTSAGVSQSPRSLPVWALVTLTVAVPLWAAAMYGTLQIHRIPEIGGWLGHGVCGPWGCAAKPEALLGYHAFWVTLLGPIGLVLGLKIEPSNGRAVWASLVIMGLLVAGGIAGWAILQCLTTGPEHLREYWLQIAGFRLATTSDAPGIPIALAGLFCWLGLAIQKKWRAADQDEFPPAGTEQVASPLDAPRGLVEQSPAAAAGSLGTP